MPRLCARLLLCLGLVAGFAVTLSAANKGLDVLISADAIPSPEGFRPKPGAPIPYLLTQNRLTLGDAVAGVKLPDTAAVEKAVVAELEKQGFVRTGLGGPLPKIVIVATLGDANFEQPRVPPSSVNPYLDPDFGPYLDQVNVRGLLQQGLFAGRVSADSAAELFTTSDDGYPSSNSDLNEARDLVLTEAIRLRERGSARGRDRGQILGLVGASKVERGVSQRAMSSSEAEKIVWVTRSNQLYLTLTAFDATRWQDKQKVPLWRTTMLIDWRSDFTKSLADMLAQAGPHFGTDVAVPGFVNTARPREGKVEIGDAKVIPEKEAPGSAGTKK